MLHSSTFSQNVSSTSQSHTRSGSYTPLSQRQLFELKLTKNASNSLSKLATDCNKLTKDEILTQFIEILPQFIEEIIDESTLFVNYNSISMAVSKQELESIFDLVFNDDRENSLFNKHPFYTALIELIKHVQDCGQNTKDILELSQRMNNKYGKEECSGYYSMLKMNNNFLKIIHKLCHLNWSEKFSSLFGSKKETDHGTKLIEKVNVIKEIKGYKENNLPSTSVADDISDVFPLLHLPPEVFRIIVSFLNPVDFLNLEMAFHKSSIRTFKRDRGEAIVNFFPHVITNFLRETVNLESGKNVIKLNYYNKINRFILENIQKGSIKTKDIELLWNLATEFVHENKNFKFTFKDNNGKFILNILQYIHKNCFHINPSILTASETPPNSSQIASKSIDTLVSEEDYNLRFKTSPLKYEQLSLFAKNLLEGIKNSSFFKNSGILSNDDGPCLGRISENTLVIHNMSNLLKILNILAEFQFILKTDPILEKFMLNICRHSSELKLQNDEFINLLSDELISHNNGPSIWYPYDERKPIGSRIAQSY